MENAGCAPWLGYVPEAAYCGGQNEPVRRSTIQQSDGPSCNPPRTLGQLPFRLRMTVVPRREAWTHRPKGPL